MDTWRGESAQAGFWRVGGAAMKGNWIDAARCGRLAAWPGAVLPAAPVAVSPGAAHRQAPAGPCPAQPAFAQGLRRDRPPLGLPEQSLLLFCSFTNVVAGLPLPPPALIWRISIGPELVTAPATSVVVNCQFSDRAQVAFVRCSASLERNRSSLADLSFV